MKTKSLLLGLALVLSGCAFVPFPAQAGPGYRVYNNNSCEPAYRGNGWGNRSYGYRQPVRYYRPVQYAPSYGYYQRPAVQIGFSFGGGGGWNNGWNRGGNCR